MNDPKPRRPGDLILDRYMPDATEEEREEARANLKAYVAAVIAIRQRIDRETGDREIGEKSDLNVESSA